jgi:hypothetical protein
MAKYGPTPPYRQQGTDLVSQLTPGAKGTQYGPELLSSDVGEWVTFNDGLAHQIATLLIDSDITLSARITCEAEDTTIPKQSAFFVVDNSLIVPVGGPVQIVGAPAFLGHTPNAPPWNTITAAVVSILPRSVGVVVQDNRVVPAPIRWRALIRIYNAQARS